MCCARGGAGSDRIVGGYGMGEDQAGRRGRPFDETGLRRALGHFATGITVVTTRDHQRRPRAITVSAFSSLSLDPPLVLFCLGRSAFHFKVFADAKAFAINVLSADQEALSARFAREAEDAFADLAVTELATGSPILKQCPAALDCETEAIHEAGDHLIIVGRVTAIDRPGGSDPLIYYRGAYRGLRP